MSLKKMRALYIGLLLLGCAMLLALVYNSYKTNRLYAENGILDLQADQSFDTPLLLCGQWEYFDSHLIVTEKGQNIAPTGMIDVPSYLPAKATADKSVTRYASYRLRLTHCPPEASLLLLPQGLPSAYRVFLNGEPLVKSGVTSFFSENVEISAGYSEEQIIPLRASTCEIIIEVAGGLMPGVCVPPVLMDRSQYLSLNGWLRLLAVCLLGIGLVFAVDCGINVYLNPHGSYSIHMLVIMVLFLLKGIASEEFFASFHVLKLLHYDWFVLFADIAELTAWILLLWHTRKNAGPFWKCGILLNLAWLGSLAAGWLALRTGSICFWLYSTVLIFVLLVLRIFLQPSLQHKRDYLLQYSLVPLWLGSAMSDCVWAGLLPMYDMVGVHIGLTAFLLVVRYLENERVAEVQTQVLKMAQMRTQLQQAKIEMALHQIKPHFLHNALLSIKVLCRTSPQKAEEAICDFSVFLRNNMNSIESNDPIPFSQELQAIQGYLHLEQIRFGDRLKVEYDIQYENFSLPPLTIQPLVENAVRHGICEKVEGGTVHLITRQCAEGARITIVDDGVGFDMAEQEKGGGIGLKNLRLRLQEQVNGTVEIESEKGVGTKQTVLIPCGRK